MDKTPGVSGEFLDPVFIKTWKHWLKEEDAFLESRVMVHPLLGKRTRKLSPAKPKRQKKKL